MTKTAMAQLIPISNAKVQAGHVDIGRRGKYGQRERKPSARQRTGSDGAHRDRRDRMGDYRRQSVFP